MKHTAYELIIELIGYTDISDPTISAEAKKILFNLRKEFKKIDENNDHRKQEKMIALFIGGTIAAIKQDDIKYNYRILPPQTQNAYEIAANKFSQQEIHLDSPEFMYELGKEALLNLPHSFCGNLFKLKAMLLNVTECVPFFPQLFIHADKVDKLVKFCIDHKDNLESSDPIIEESIHCDNIPVEFVDEFVKKHNKSLRCGLFGGFFNRTNLKQYDNLAPEDILAHAKQRTFFGFKNRTRQILEEMEVMNSDGNLIKESVKSNLLI